MTAPSTADTFRPGDRVRIPAKIAWSMPAKFGLPVMGELTINDRSGVFTIPFEGDIASDGYVHGHVIPGVPGGYMVDVELDNGSAGARVRVMPEMVEAVSARREALLSTLFDIARTGEAA